MSLSDPVQVSLSILQIVGLLIPVVFLSLREYFPEDLGKGNAKHDGGRDTEAMDYVDDPPDIIRLGWLVVASLATAGVFASVRVLVSVLKSPLVILSVLFLAGGLIGLGYIFYKIRSSFGIILF